MAVLIRIFANFDSFGTRSLLECQESKLKGIDLRHGASRQSLLTELVSLAGMHFVAAMPPDPHLLMNPAFYGFRLRKRWKMRTLLCFQLLSNKEPEHLR